MSQHHVRGSIGGDFKQIVILTEKDMSKIEELMCGVSCQLIIVPRPITKEERNLLELSIMDGTTFFGKIVQLK